MKLKTLHGLTGHLKDKLIQQALERRLRQAEGAESDGEAGSPALRPDNVINEKYYRFHLHPGYQKLRIIADASLETAGCCRLTDDADQWPETACWVLKANVRFATICMIQKPTSIGR